MQIERNGKMINVDLADAVSFMPSYKRDHYVGEFAYKQPLQFGDIVSLSRDLTFIPEGEQYKVTATEHHLPNGKFLTEFRRIGPRATR